MRRRAVVAALFAVLAAAAPANAAVFAGSARDATGETIPARDITAIAGRFAAGTGPDQRGTYQVLPAGTIRFEYDSGATVTRSAFLWNPAKGRDPDRAGLHLGDDTYLG